jgi:hypothetical protein
MSLQLKDFTVSANRRYVGHYLTCSYRTRIGLSSEMTSLKWLYCILHRIWYNYASHFLFESSNYKLTRMKLSQIIHYLRWINVTRYEESLTINKLQDHKSTFNLRLASSFQNTLHYSYPCKHFVFRLYYFDFKANVWRCE